MKNNHLDFILEPIDKNRLAYLIGPEDENLVQIQKRLGVTIAYSGSHFHIEGEHKACKDAEYIIKKLGEGVKVAELEGIPGASATRERGEGFHKVADQKLSVVAKQSADFDRTKGLTVSENMLQANPDIQAIFAQNDEMALGAIEASKSAGKQIFIVGFDGTDDGLKAVEAGTMAATIAQQPELMGQQGLEAAVKLAKGEKIDAKISVPLKLVEKK